MTALHQWFARWRIPAEAQAELLATFQDQVAVADPLGAEAHVMMQVRQEATRRGGRLWRNNVGATYTDEGAFLRYGLCNESKAMNTQLKSSDLVGIMPLRITPAHVGSTVGQFMAREVKAPGWRYTGTPRERAQQNYLTLVASLGGDAAFVTGVGQ